MARLRSDFWVSAYLRQRAVAGVAAVLRRRGAAEAGAIFIKVDRLDGTARLFGPAPPDLESQSPGRQFALMLEADPLAVEDRMARELRFDSDLWLIEVEDRSGDPAL
ncbi:MAG: DUF1491 family protein [Beijerinckiaceae bacterium]|nr:DUF1491 family protein [Beijerinckiaceae bacterium]